MVGRPALKVGQHGLVRIRAFHFDTAGQPISWQARARYGDTDGVTRTVSRNASSEEEAILRLSQALTPDRQPPDQPAPRINLQPDRPHVVYRFYDAADRLLYVGMSLNARGRLMCHKYLQPWWRDAVRIDLARHPDWESARDAERDAIQDENPLYNIAP